MICKKTVMMGDDLVHKKEMGYVVFSDGSQESRKAFGYGKSQKRNV